MPGVESHLHVVPPCPREDDAPAGDVGDAALVLMIFVVAALPLASALAGLGRWDGGSLGLGTLGVLVTGRELGVWLVARCRTGRNVRSP